MEQIIEEQIFEEQIVEKKGSLVEYLLLGFVILWSGGFFSYGLFLPNWPYVLFAISLYILIRQGLKLETKHFVVISLFALVALFQAVVFNGPITSIIKPTVRLLAIAMVAIIVRPNLNHVFIRITTFLAFFSLVFWLVDLSQAGHEFLLNVANGLPQLGADKLNESMSERYKHVNHTLYFYTVSTGDREIIGSMFRNCGPFYEPGRFAIPLCISLAMILFTGNFKEYKTSFFIILIANLTTMSTTGYLVMSTLLIGYYIGRSDSRGLHRLTMLLLVFIGVYYLMGLSFMGAKISTALNDTEIANSRFGAMFYHLPQIVKSPLIGYGAFLEEVFSNLEMSPCGITDMMRRWGIPMFVVCVVLLYQGTRSYIGDNRMYRIVFVTILLFNAYTQTIMFDPLYILLYFIGSQDEVYDEVYDDEEEEEEDINDETYLIDDEVIY